VDSGEEPASKLEERAKCEIFEDFCENGAIAMHIVGNDGTILNAKETLNNLSNVAH
jgi:hypothetical protein